MKEGPVFEVFSATGTADQSPKGLSWKSRLGEDGDQALLAVVTLEILGLVFNPFDRTLQPMRMLLC